MNILLYLQDRIEKFKLPSEVSGSFSFDAQDSDNKLINVDAMEGSWVLYSTDDAKVLGPNNSYIEKVKLIPNNFYVLEKEKIKYLIYTEEKSFKNMIALSVDYVNPLVITNNENSSIKYTCPYISNLNISVTQRNGVLYLKKDNNIIYRNKKVLRELESIIKDGDEIELCGVRFLFIKNNVYVNDIGNRLVINQGVSQYQFPELEKMRIKLYGE